MSRYYTPTRADHERARQDYIDRVPMPSTCMHSVPLAGDLLCRECEEIAWLEETLGIGPNDMDMRPAFFDALDMSSKEG